MKNSNKIDIKDDLIISQANSDDMGTILDVQKKSFYY
jgi:hypothetical protein